MNVNVIYLSSEHSQGAFNMHFNYTAGQKDLVMQRENIKQTIPTKYRT